MSNIKKSHYYYLLRRKEQQGIFVPKKWNDMAE